MKAITKYVKLVTIYLVMFQCCLGFTVYKYLRVSHIHHYIHSKDCQLKSALGIDCFDTCNGVQYNSEESQKKDKDSSDKIIHSEIQAIIVNSQKIHLVQTAFVPHIIYRDVNLSKGAENSIFQPPKTDC